MTIRRMSINGFRGIAQHEIEPAGRSLLVVGGNGTGKSSIVDGIEYVLSGKVDRFQGIGAVKHDRAIRHVRKRHPLSVTIHCADGEHVTRGAGENDLVIEGVIARAFADGHNAPGQFILRRGSLLEFIQDRDADRYTRFIRLLNLNHIERLQREVIEAAKQAKSRDAIATQALESKLGALPKSGFEVLPRTITGLLDEYRAAQILLNESIPQGGLEEIAEQGGKPPRIHAASTAQIVVETLRSRHIDVQSTIVLAAEKLDEVRESLIACEEASAGVEMSERAITVEARRYFDAHPELSECPVCEQVLDGEFDASLVLASLRSRSQQYESLEHAESRLRHRRNELDLILGGLRSSGALDLKSQNLVGDKIAAELERALVSTCKPASELATQETIDERVEALGRVGAAWTATIDQVKPSVGAAPEDSHITASVFLDAVDRGASDLLSLAAKASASATIHERAIAVRSAFSSARESYVQSFLDRIASRVMSFYAKLHGAGRSSPQVSDLAFKSSRQSQAGGVKLLIDFLGIEAAVDPREHLSEGHVDSLGLALFLAAVAESRPAGSIVVLDDVVTSIDIAHRHRVAELLRDEFQGFQLIVTTHDERWAARLEGVLNAANNGKEFWHRIDFHGWDIDSGPRDGKLTGEWEFIESNLDEKSFRNLGGPMRRVYESFLQRTADRLSLRVGYRRDGRYDAGSFWNAGLAKHLRKELAKVVDEANMVAIDQSIGRVFGDTSLTNHLVHDSISFDDVPYEEVADFVDALRSLESACLTHKLVSGR